MKLLLAFIICLLPFSGQAADDEPLRILNPATLVAPAQLDSTSIYMVIDNPALEPDEIIEASSPLAAEGALYGTAYADGQFRPYPVAGIMVLPASTTTLGPRGNHIKLIGLKHAPEVGDEVTVALTLKKAGVMTVKAKVLSAIDFVKLYPVETAMMTIKKLQAEQARNLSR